MRGNEVGAARRIGVSLAVYLAVAALLLVALPTIQRLLLLPVLFSTLVRIGLAAGVPIIALVAWRYPAVGEDTDTDA